MRNIKILFFLLVLFSWLTQEQLTADLNKYIQDEKESLYYVFKTYDTQNYQQHFPGFQKLVYTTPWNPHGAELTIKYAHKLDYVVPCWYDITFKKQHILLDSDSNYNQTYINELRRKNKAIKIIPRVYIGGSQKQIIQAIGSVQGRFKRAVSLIATLINKQDVDGLVIQTSYNLFLRDTSQSTQQQKSTNTAIKNLLIQLVNSIRINLFKKKQIFFSVPNPKQNYPIISHQRYAMLNVDGYLISSYDSIQYEQQLNSAVQWAKHTLKYKNNLKFFILLPFFARRQRQGINSMEVVNGLRKNGLLVQNIENTICNFIQAKSNIQSYVPCYHYFETSFEKIQFFGFNAGFWEAGSALQNYFLFL